MFTPTRGFTGTTTFTFIAHDGTLTSPPATVTVTVGDAPLGAPPGAGAASAQPMSPPDATTDAGTTLPSASPAPSDSDLSKTGSDSALLLFVGVGAALLAASGLVLLAHRGRRRPD